jgi:hypothetical protein
VVGQAHETLENIAALVSEDNLGRHGLPGWGTTLEGLAVARVYVKRPQDYVRVREVCQQRLGEVPATYVVADVCRPDLLVEIEGVAFSRKAASASPATPRRRHVGRVPVACCATGVDETAPYCPETCPERLLCPHAVLRQNTELVRERGRS